LLLLLRSAAILLTPAPSPDHQKQLHAVRNRRQWRGGVTAALGVRSAIRALRSA